MTDYPGTIFPKYFINKKLSCTWGPQCAEAGCYKKKKGSIVDSSTSKKNALNNHRNHFNPCKSAYAVNNLKGFVVVVFCCFCSFKRFF